MDSAYFNVSSVMGSLAWMVTLHLSVISGVTNFLSNWHILHKILNVTGEFPLKSYPRGFFLVSAFECRVISFLSSPSPQSAFHRVLPLPPTVGAKY